MRYAKAFLAVPSALALGAVFAVPAAAHNGEDHSGSGSSEGHAGEHSIMLDSLNESGASGSAMLEMHDDGSLTVMVEGENHVPGQAHAMHIHGSTDMNQDFQCPGANADEDGDGIVSTAEGVPDYGDIHISLTTEGDSSPDSGLAVDRFPAADEDGHFTYERTFSAEDVPEGTAEAIQNLHIVTHGIDRNDNGEYDDEAGESSLDPELPLEATAPASCGMVEGSNVTDMPDGGVDTGSGPVATDGAGGAGVALGALGAAGLAGYGFLRRRQPQS